MERRCMGCMETYDEQYEICLYCGYVHGTPPKEAYHITPGSLLAGRYIIGRVLGFGGFGITYIGYDQVLQNKVAIKEYMPGEFSTRMPNQQMVTVYSGDRAEQFREGMLKIIDEARRLAQFQDEPNIVHIYDCFEANNTAYIVMEYLDGESVKELLARQGRIPLDQALDIVLKVISAMKKVHEIGIIHRDIAPDNIYILKDGNVKILDFGAARYATTKHSKSLSVIIKPGYAPEEQYRSRGDQGPWTDVYALAATFYKMITGVTPEDAMERSVKDQLKKPSKLGISIPKGMETAIMNGLNVRIEDRTQSMEEFEKELLAAEVKEKVARQRKADVGKIPMWAKITAAVGVLAVAVLAVVVMTFNFMPKLEEYVLPEGKTMVPNMVNQDLETAEQMGNEKQITVIADTMKYSAVIPAGNVTSQSVPTGTVVDVLSEVRLEISRGKEKVAVPMVLGMSLEEATAALEEAELTVETREVDNENFAPGSVVSQSIEGNTTAVKGDSILLEIAKDNGLGDASILVEVPQLAGMNYTEAQELLKQNYLYLYPSYEYSDTVAADVIISQETAAGEQLPQKSNIRVTVSMGREKVQVPGVEFMEAQAARDTLEAAGLTVETREEYSGTVEVGKVISQSVAADEMAEKGTLVTLTISRGPAPVRQETPARTQAPANRPAATQPAPTQAPTQPQPAPTEPPTTQAPTQTATQAPTQPATTQAPNSKDDLIGRQLEGIGAQ